MSAPMLGPYAKERRYYIGRTVAELRHRAGITQFDLAVKIGRKERTIWRWEHYEAAGIKDSDCRKLAQALGVSLEALIGASQLREAAPPAYAMAVPIVSRVRVSRRTGKPEYQSVAHASIEFTSCKAVEVSTNALVPIVSAGQCLLYSETDPPHDGDLVFCKPRGRGPFFKRYHVKKQQGRRQVLLLGPNPATHEPPMTMNEGDLLWCYRVVGIRF